MYDDPPKKSDNDVYYTLQESLIIPNCPFA